MLNKKKCFFILSLAGALLMGGCTHPEKGAIKQLKTVKEQWLEEVQFQEEGAERETLINWDEALRLLYTDNLTLRRERENVRRSRESIKDVYRNLLIPNISANGSLTREVRDLKNFKIKDFKINFSGYLGLTNIKGIFTGLYSARLSHLHSILAYDAAVREQTIELYKTFFEYDQLLFKEQNLIIQEKIATQFASINKRQGSLKLEELETEQFNMEKEKKAFQTKMNRLLGSRRVNWVLDKEGLPQFDYLNHPLDVRDVENVNQRGMQKLALDLESLRLAERGIRLEYWPQINPNINFPELFSGTLDKKAKGFSLKKTSVGISSYWNLDTHGRIGRRLRDFKIDKDLRIREARQQAQEMIDKLLDSVVALEKLEKQKNDLKNQWMLYDKLLATQGLSQYEKILQTRKSLLERQLQLNQNFADINTLLWFIDDKRWPSLKFESYKLNDPTLAPKRKYRRSRGSIEVIGQDQDAQEEDDALDLDESDPDDAGFDDAEADFDQDASMDADE